MLHLAFAFACALTNVGLNSSLYYVNPPLPGELLITEIMADPSPGAGYWPECEYLEVYNNAQRPLSLGSIRLKAGSRTVVLPEVQLFPGEFLLLCPKGQSAGFGSAVKALELVTFPVLSNAGAPISLSNAQGQVLESLEYSDSWYRDGKKKNGGWSLERIRNDHPAYCPANWQASRGAGGGTPGLQPVVHPSDIDTAGPVLLQAFPEASMELRITFDEIVRVPTPVMLEIHPFLPVRGVESAGDGSELLVILDRPMQEGVIYTFSVAAELADCIGNPSGKRQSVTTGIPARPEKGDIAVNEILYEAAAGGEDFIELVNNSEKLISLEGLILRNAQKADGLRETSIGFPWLLSPGQYLALCSDPAGLRQQYRPPDSAGIVFALLPTLEAPQGNISLLMSGKLLDSVDYSKTWHHPLLKDTRGIALERINPRVSGTASNWTSSAKGATPGYRNSQFFPNTISGQQVKRFFELERPVFSPDGDGFEDELILNFYPPEPGYLASIFIFDANGRAVAEIASNVPLPAEGVFIWDGKTSAGNGPVMGVYVIRIECFHPSGHRVTGKMTCTLSIPFR